MKKILLLVALMATMGLSAQAQEVKAAPQRHGVPAYRGLIVRDLPNGYELRTYLRGDEHFHYAMTEDGWQIIENTKGWFKYAKKNRKGQVVSHWRKAHNVEDRSRCEKKWLEKHGIKKQ
jgi:hypothetical protein